MIGGFSYYLWIQVASVINGVTGRTDDKLTGNKQNKETVVGNVTLHIGARYV